jgi:hypothetical protein
MKLNISKTQVNTFTRKNNVLYYVHKISVSCITCTETIKNLGVKLYSKLHLYEQVDYTFFQPIRMLGLIQNITFSFSALDCLLMLYLTLVRPKHASTAWNSVISITHSEKLECIQLKFVAPCQNSLLSHKYVTFLKF